MQKDKSEMLNFIVVSIVLEACQKTFQKIFCSTYVTILYKCFLHLWSLWVWPDSHSLGDFFDEIMAQALLLENIEMCVLCNFIQK